MTKLEILSQCRVEGNVVKLPDGQLDKKLYTEVKNALDKIGGTWRGGKVFGFVFEKDPTELLQDIAGGKKRNIKQEFQFFATPSKIADRLVKLADIKKGETILEPSAGRGAIIDAIKRLNIDVDNDIYCCELMEENRRVLFVEKGCNLIEHDFLKLEPKFKYDKIIANPPFSSGQDILHVKKMYDCLNNGGRLVSIMSTHWELSKNKKETEFKNWIKSVDAEIIKLKSGDFKESGTNVETLIIIINKNETN